MDRDRLKHLQQLAGLELAPGELNRLQIDLTAIEEAAAALLDSKLEARPLAGQPGSTLLAGPVIREMDWDLMTANAPDFAGGFFRIPAVDTSVEGEER